MKFLFKGGNELVKMDLDREKKELLLSSSNTNYKLIKTAWTKLFDPGKETVQEKITDTLSDKEFHRTIIAAMSQQGYSLVRSSYN